VVPVIKNADKKSPGQINREINIFEEKSKVMRFRGDDLSGGHFTISNLGMYGIDRFRAIVNPPQGSILAVGRVKKTPVCITENTVVIRPMMNLTLSVDHRCMDGVQGARFLSIIRELIEEPELFLNE
jgi:pyruvate dehydrogenase E2 component (dihydrolipoamide acetyltransferase)